MGRIAVTALVAGVFCVGATASAQGYSVVGSGGPTGAAAPGAEGAAGGGNGSGAQRVPHAEREQGTREQSERQGGAGLEAPHQAWEYGGVVPGNGVTPPGLSRRSVRHAGGRVVIAWPGFQVRPEGSRIFLAVTAPAQLVAESTPGALVYHVRNAAVPVRNNRRPLETEAFDTPVKRAYLRPHGRDVDLVIELRAQTEPRLTQQNNTEGLGFVYVDFPPWSRPQTERTVRSTVPSQRARPAAPVRDEERPPPVQP